MTTPVILVNTNRCTGCWTCSMTCKVGNKLGEREWWNYIETIGSGKGVDEPGGVWPNLYMKWRPIYTQKCTMCGKRVKDGDQPFCTYNCPTHALTYGDLDDPDSPINVRMAELKEIGFHFSEKKAFENTRRNIIYAER